MERRTLFLQNLNAQTPRCSQNLRRPSCPRRYDPNAQPWFPQRLLRGFRRLVPGFLPPPRICVRNGHPWPVAYRKKERVHDGAVSWYSPIPGKRLLGSPVS